ncbi:putative Blue copper protein precursor [Tripterygium wilfordii]|uniref:Putative Blue copper protein n=1 Tax=Tripterygium wilfordii TaxID=458696 RepID=A0A7J7DL29_TRIWF|nr:blue copper protein-like [Tripterygium wilfordii]KAF5746786.1 putative Blue copper protein precursor [Tripterygium wilfordii]
MAMASISVLLVLCMVVPITLATDYTVGDSTGWVMGVDYSTWTSGKTFTVGDKLVFSYGGGHSVDEVSGSDYNSCTVGNSLTTDSSGATTITLNKAGTHYFICGAIGHCGSGMKLAVTVGSGSPTSTNTSPAASGGSTTTTTPTTTTPKSNMPESSSGNLSPFVGLVITWVSLFVLNFS